MNGRNTLYLKVGTVSYEVTSTSTLLPQADCAEFFTSIPPLLETGDIKVHCELKVVDVSSAIQGTVVHQDSHCIILEHEGLERRLLLDHRGASAYYWEKSHLNIVIEICQADKTRIAIDTYFLEAFALDRFLLRTHALVLHSAFIEWKGKGILFTAPSGTGKSTQASLWQKHEGVEIINGDRSLLIRHPDGKGFDCCGLPFCGSSGIHLNRRMPLGAVVFIEQSPVNIVESMPMAQAVSRLFGESSINKWNETAVRKSLDLIENLASSTPMIRLKCNMNPDAVSTLKTYLQEKW